VLFPTHLVAGALLAPAARQPTPWVVLGAALPDVIDKPLGSLGVFEFYHSVGHSLASLAVVTALALAWPTLRALAVGWGTHIALDGLHVVVNGRPGHLLAFLWPVAESADPLGLPPGAFAAYYVGTPAFAIDVGLWLLFLGVLLARWRAGEVTAWLLGRDGDVESADER